MPDEATQAPAPEATDAAATPEAQPVEARQSEAPQLTQADIDRAVTNARKAWEAKQAEAANAEREAAERKKLEEAGKFEELKARLEAEKDAAQKTLTAERIRMRLEVEAVRAGIRDPQDLAMVKADAAELLAEDGSVNDEAVKAAVAGLKESKPYLFQDATDTPKGAKGTPSPGSATPTDGFDLQAYLSPEAYKARQTEALERKKNLRGPDMSTTLQGLLAGRRK